LDFFNNEQIDEPTKKNLNGIFNNYGMQFADNFADWIDSPNDDKCTIEQLANFKARLV